MLISSVLDQKYRFLINLFQKVKIVILSWTLVLTVLIWICRINGVAYFFPVRPKIPVSGKVVPKNRSSHFKLKFRIFANFNMQNSIMMLPFSVLGQKYHSWANFDQKIKILTLSWTLVLTLIWICRI